MKPTLEQANGIKGFPRGARGRYSQLAVQLKCNILNFTQIYIQTEKPDHGKYHFFQKELGSRISSGRYPESLGLEFPCTSTLDRPS